MKRNLYCLLIIFVIYLSVQELSAAEPVFHPRESKDYVIRKGVGHTLAKLASGDSVKIAYLGGSITETGDGWRPQTTAWFQKKWPKAQITEIHAAIGATGSEIGVYRMERDVLKYKPDLLFVEFAVNDGGCTPENIWKQFEGIIRKTWKANPHTDIVFCYTIVSGMIEGYRQGNLPTTAAAMEQIADFYGIPSIDFGPRVVKLMEEDKLVFKADSPVPGKILFSRDGTHPIASGSALYTLDVERAMNAMIGMKGVDHGPELAKTFIKGNLENVSMVPVTKEMLKGNWFLLKDGVRYSQYKRWLDQVWCTETPGSRIEFRFKGSHVKLYDIPATNGGQVWITVDGRKSGPVSRFHWPWWSRLNALHVGMNLDPNKVHTVSVELDAKMPDRSQRDPSVPPAWYEGCRFMVGQIMLDGELVP